MGQIDVGVAQTVLGGLAAKLIDQRGERRTLIEQAALQGLGVLIELRRNHFQLGGTGGQQLTRDGADRLAHVRAVGRDQGEIFNHGPVREFVVAERAVKVGGADGEAGGGL
jgi:hypothetical protein